MKIMTMWGMRADEVVPELMVAWDEDCVEANPDGFEQECADARSSWGDQLAAFRFVEIEVRVRHIIDHFRPLRLDGTVDPFDSQENP